MHALRLSLMRLNLCTAPESLSQAQCFQIPLPAGTAPPFKIVIISYGRIGFNLHATASNKDHIRVAPGVERMVNNATMPLEDILESNALFVQRAYVSLLPFEHAQPQP